MSVPYYSTHVLRMANLSHHLQIGMLSNKHIFVEYPSESITNITDSHINCREMHRQLPILLKKK